MITFRPLAEPDIDAVVALWTDCGLVRPWNDARRDIDFARGKEGSDILLGFADGALVSSVLVGHDGHRGWLYYLAVAPASQGRGIGRETVAAAEEWLKARGIWAVNLNIRSENEKVLAYVELFQGRLRPFIQDGLDRGGQYLPMIQNVFRAEGLPLDLAYVPLIESAFKTNALSVKSARGVWQFVHATALENGLRHDWYIDERSDPEKATKAAAKYLKTLSRIFDGDWHLALASYNGGPGRVQRAMKRTGRDDFWELSSNKRWLPRETREYVPMILAAMVIARNPAQYGFSFTPSSPMPRETVNVSGPLDLRRVAEWTGTPVDTIEQLNPELRRWTTPVRGAAYTLKVPEGTADTLEKRLNETPESDRVALNWHTVKSGETLLTIARKLRVSRGDLAEANYLSVKARVRPGQKLITPREPATLMAAQPDRPTPPLEPRPTVERASLVSAPDTSNEPEVVRRVYKVKRGDTLASIAQRFDTSVSSIKTWNRLHTNRISAGQRLTVYIHRDN